MARAPVDPFFKKLHERLFEEVTNRIHALAESGASVRSNEGLLLDPVNTAIKYEKDVAVIRAYQEVIALCFELDRETFGGKYNNEDGDD